MIWSPELRLKLIKALAQMRQEDSQQSGEADTLQRIMFLTDMPSEFLELNKGNYKDAIEYAHAELSASI